MTEQEMRDAEAAHPKTTADLADYINELVNQEHDYGTCVYAMSMAATAAFNLVAHRLGVTGFQASCADMDILRRTRSIKGPFMLIDGENMLYPQYDLQAKLAEAMDEWREWARGEAAKLLAKNEKAHPDVIAHWKQLSA